MGFKTPYFGPNAGKLCKDGVPVKDLPDGFVASLPVLVPDFVPSDTEPRYRRGIEGAARDIYAEHQRWGSDQSFEQVKARVVRGRHTSERKRTE